MSDRGFNYAIVDEIRLGVDTAPLSRMARVLMDRQEELNLPSGLVNIVFVTDEVMVTMNREYSGNDYATDVLSFNYLESGDAIDGVIGEIIIDFEVAARQAMASGTTTGDEVALLGLHGVLHIAGHDHQNQATQQEISRIQAEIMQAADVPYREFAWQD